MDFAPYKRSLMISAALAVVLAACAWYYDALLMAMLCVVAVMWQLARLFYYLLRWNRGALAAILPRYRRWCCCRVANNSFAIVWWRITCG